MNDSEVHKYELGKTNLLRDELKALVSLAMLFEGDVLHVARSAPDDWPSWNTTVGRRVFVHCTSPNKVLLDHQLCEEVEALIEQHQWWPYSPNLIQDLERLGRELEIVRTRGYAVDNEELNIGTVCVGPPVIDYSGLVIAALSVSSKLAKMSETSRTEFADKVREAANQISFRLGYQKSFTYL